jgi:sugar-phosphatase
LSKQILDQTIELISTQASPTDGLNELITFLKNSPLRLGLATSSSQPVIDAVLQRLQLTNVFDVALSADEVVNGKPAPDVYLEVCKRMKVIPERCFSLEDSLTGVKAAVAAGTKTIAFPAHDNNDFTIAFQRVAHLSEVANIVESNMGESE